MKRPNVKGGERLLINISADLVIDLNDVIDACAFIKEAMSKLECHGVVRIDSVEVRMK